ncbi:MAG: hypothetical protein D6761_05210 [Candidatus Dadabacteria bacterium]|nr:MAG: hypothetical protein D6761_05210 [Candidatus Dadabacteria bacterium]
MPKRHILNMFGPSEPYFDGTDNGARLIYKKRMLLAPYHALVGGCVAARDEARDIFQLWPTVDITLGGQDPILNLVLPNEEYFQGADLADPDNGLRTDEFVSWLPRLDHWIAPRKALQTNPELAETFPVPYKPSTLPLLELPWTWPLTPMQALIVAPPLLAGKGSRRLLHDRITSGKRFVVRINGQNYTYRYSFHCRRSMTVSVIDDDNYTITHFLPDGTTKTTIVRDGKEVPESG